ncbi:hypothetical protein K7432_012502 [Basidiobolus ranarum]|uniref:Carbonic anhydrase n=1 Tax=Basidiobolus ranarum TaxID=34480 RepID=A0ABR2WKW3_9FUNG
MRLYLLSAFLVSSIILIDASPTDERQINWKYGGLSGPQRWGDLDPSFATCKTGRYQSPIDITRTSAKLVENHPLQLKWHKEHLKNVTMVNNGHTLQINMPAENRVELKREGVHYYLRQFHIHTPSEHHINGRYYDAEVHLVMSDKDNEKYQVLGVLMGLSDEPSKFLQDISSEHNIPDDAGQSILLHRINLRALITEVDDFREYYSYEGSLTTPPCTEGVRWIVAKNPAKMTWRQLDDMRQGTHYNARYVQQGHKIKSTHRTRKNMKLF